VAQPSGVTDGGKREQHKSRQRRLSAALRQNLKRRKAQARARTLPAEGVERAAGTHDSAGFAEHKRDG
jgi:hypothetical protein